MLKKEKNYRAHMNFFFQIWNSLMVIKEKKKNSLIYTFGIGSTIRLVIQNLYVMVKLKWTNCSQGHGGIKEVLFKNEEPWKHMAECQRELIQKNTFIPRVIKLTQPFHRKHKIAD